MLKLVIYNPVDTCTTLGFTAKVLNHNAKCEFFIRTLIIRGHPFMMFTKKITFLTPLPLSTWAGPPSALWTSTHGRHKIHTALLKWLVKSRFLEGMVHKFSE